MWLNNKGQLKKTKESKRATSMMLMYKWCEMNWMIGISSPVLLPPRGPRMLIAVKHSLLPPFKKLKKALLPPSTPRLSLSLRSWIEERRSTKMESLSSECMNRSITKLSSFTIFLAFFLSCSLFSSIGSCPDHHSHWYTCCCF